MKVIGITGPSGSGKTALSELIKAETNSEILNADEIVKESSKKRNTLF